MAQTTDILADEVRRLYAVSKLNNTTAPVDGSVSSSRWPGQQPQHNHFDHMMTADLETRLALLLEHEDLVLQRAELGQTEVQWKRSPASRGAVVPILVTVGLLAILTGLYFGEYNRLADRRTRDVAVVGLLLMLVPIFGMGIVAYINQTLAQDQRLVRGPGIEHGSIKSKGWRGGLLNTTYVLYFRFYRGTAVFIDTLRDDGVAFFLATTTAILLFLAQTVASASEPAIAWALSNPGLLLFASIDIWLLRFDRAALSRVLAHVSLIRTQTDATAQVASVAGLTPVACKSVPDLEDMSLRNGVRTANVLSQCNVARRFYTVTFVTHLGGIAAVCVPLLDLEGRLSGFAPRGADVLRYITIAYGILTVLTAFLRYFWLPTSQFTVRHRGAFAKMRAITLNGDRFRSLLAKKWTPGVDWLATKADLVLESREEMTYFENIEALGFEKVELN